MRNGTVMMAALLLALLPGTASAQDAPHPASSVRLAADRLLVFEAEFPMETAVGFGSDKESVLHYVVAVAGAPIDKGSNSECGAGPLDNIDFVGGLRLYFQADELVGWELDEKATFRTAEDVGIGTTWAELVKRLGEVDAEDSSIGHEFLGKGYSGLLSGPGASGRVTALWAGTTCIFR